MCTSVNQGPSRAEKREDGDNHRSLMSRNGRLFPSALLESALSQPYFVFHVCVTVFVCIPVRELEIEPCNKRPSLPRWLLQKFGLQPQQVCQRKGDTCCYQCIQSRNT